MFKKVTENTYLYVGEDLSNEVNELVNNISLDNVTAFTPIFNDNLKDTIMSRLLASKFIQQHKEEVIKNKFITIKAELNGVEHLTSTGVIVDNEKEFVMNGVINT